MRSPPDVGLAGARKASDLLELREDDVWPLVNEGFKILEIFELADIPGSGNGSPWMLTVAKRLACNLSFSLFHNALSVTCPAEMPAADSFV